MDLNKIHYFFRAAELQNFTKAAQACHIAQTTMSKYIAVLEHELGVSLFVRNHKTAVLTPQGERFYKEMKKIAEQYQDLCQDILRDTYKELRIGMVTTDYADFQVLCAFEKEFPTISVHFSFAEGKKLLSDLEHHRLDALICPNILNFYRNSEQELRYIDLVRIKESIVCSKELFSRCGSIENVIASQPFITKAGESDYHEFCREQLYELYGQRFSEIMVTTGFPQQLLLLNLSRGFGIIPMAKDTEYENLISFPAADVFTETAQLIWAKDFVTSGLRMLLEYIGESG